MRLTNGNMSQNPRWFLVDDEQYQQRATITRRMPMKWLAVLVSPTAVTHMTLYAGNPAVNEWSELRLARCYAHWSDVILNDPHRAGDGGNEVPSAPAFSLALIRPVMTATIASGLFNGDWYCA